MIGFGNPLYTLSINTKFLYMCIQKHITNQIWSKNTMKNIIIAIAAAGFMTLPATAEIALTGDASMGLNYNDSETPNHEFFHEVGVDFAASGSNDGSLSFGGTVGITSSSDDGESIDESTVWLAGAFGKFTIGDIDSADLIAGEIADIGLSDSVGVGAQVEDLMGTTNPSVIYEHSFGQVNVAASVSTEDIDDITDVDFFTDVDNYEYAFGMNAAIGGVTVGVGYDSLKTVSLGAEMSIDELSVGALYVKADDAATGMGGDVSYSMGQSTLTVAYTRLDEMGMTSDDFGVGVTHDLGGGASLNAGFGKVNEATKASIGLSFSL